jgi:hypothetical protein
MATLETLMLNKIIMQMKRFNINEIQHLLRILPLNLEWNEITNLVTELRLRLTVANVVSIIHYYLKEMESIEATYYRVLLADAIYHQRSLWWTVTIDKVNKRFLDKRIIQKNIQFMLVKMSIEAITYVMESNKLFWILININETKEKKTTLKLNNPYFFTIAPGKVCHIFHRPRNIDNRLMKIVSKAVGASKFKLYALSGKDLYSMKHFMEDKNKENNKGNVQTLLNSDKEEDVKEYVQKLFGNNSRILNKFTININIDLTKFNQINSEENISNTQIQLKGDSIIDGIKEMMLLGVMQPPYPDWVTRLPYLGKNSVNINLEP